MRALWVGLIVASGCTSSLLEAPDDAASTADAPTWHARVAPIFSRSCDSCHAEGGVGTPTWTTPEEIVAWAPIIADAVANRTMPPWHASSDCNTYVNDFSLTDEEIDTVVAWADADAPIGEPATAALLAEPFDLADLDRTDVLLSMDAPYTPVGAPDDYRCFVMEWPLDEPAWVTGFEVRPDNIPVVHHAIPFLIPPEFAEEQRELDAADPEPGYPCFGAPGGSINSLRSIRWLGAWAPGGGSQQTPDGTGIYVRPGSVIAFQMHYNVATADPGPDQTALALQVEEEQVEWADIQPWTDFRWVLGVGMEIPPFAEDVTHAYTYTAENGGYRIHSAALHMHTLGQTAKLSIVHPDGSETCVLEHERWDFDWQRTYELVEPVAVGPGDTLNLTCTWDNPTDQPVSWGEGTGDEMCLALTLLAD